ncbi:hypothetical protein Shyhy01_18620 [Streptomyces hygroscopicus subsp. hygroscopicus]|nr:hypothetical protein Shyhy01_18620 [Streptomyces hygroscopicus subsp. hygroscopicus]
MEDFPARLQRGETALAGFIGDDDQALELVEVFHALAPTIAAPDERGRFPASCVCEDESYGRAQQEPRAGVRAAGRPRGDAGARVRMRPELVASGGTCAGA